MLRWLARMLAVAALAPLVLPAHAVADVSAAASGSITYTWQGDPARGCAAVGVCGVQGALILSAQGVSGTSGGPRGIIDIPIDTSRSTVRAAGGPGGGDCVDVAAASPPGGDLLITRRAGRLVGQIRAGLSSGRCAGPRQQDLARIVLPVRRFGTKDRSFDLRARESFVAGPFTGTVVSTLVLRPAGTSQSGGFGGGPPLPVPAHKLMLEQVTLRYSFGSVPGTSLDATFAGESDPFCAAIASCGATGTLALAFPGLSRTLVVQASRPVRSRVSERQALADLRRGRLHVDGGELGPFSAGATARVAETFTGSDGSRCQDASSTPQSQLVVVPGPTRSAGGVSLELYDPIDAGALRTYCPGPTDADVFGNDPQLAGTSIGFAQLAARHSVVSLSRRGSFAGLGYVGTRSGALQFSLALEHVRVRTVEVRRP